MTILTTALEILAVLLALAFCVVVWWPSALLVSAAVLVFVSWQLTPSKPKPEPPT